MLFAFSSVETLATYFRSRIVVLFLDKQGFCQGRPKPMKPMQLHWAPRLWGPRTAWCLGRLFIFFPIPLALENSVETANKSHC